MVDNLGYADDVDSGINELLSIFVEKNPILLVLESGSVSSSAGVLFNTDTDSTGFPDTDWGILPSGSMTISGSELGFSGSTSLDPSDTANIEAVFGTSPYGSKAGYVYASFKNATQYSQSLVDVHVLDAQNFQMDAQEAQTPMIQSQMISGEIYDLFQFETIGAGNSANTKVKVSISNIKPAGSVNGSDYGVFTVIVRDFNDTDKKKVVLETYANVTLDPNSPNFISRVIGDRKLFIDEMGKVTESGDWANNSKYIRIKKY